MKYFLNLLILIFLYFIGILIFTSGFLLRRIVVNEKNTCSDNYCRQIPIFDKAIIVIIDALRYDFLTFNESLELQPLSYQNNFKNMHHLLKTHPANGKLYRFNADPPTTTLQRLKALTTGSLPTFIDAGSNFASTEISEDNVIDQLLRSNKSITFMGDDTWTGLYPNRFETSYPYSSFNVKDLDTVDDGVINHTFPHLEKGNYTVLIAHLLGVDHCGHTFGPSHLKMKQKLTQMDAYIKRITEGMDNGSILLVMGDHGMTRSGDHGGDSEDEVGAGLFVYSKKQLFGGGSSSGSGSSGSGSGSGGSGSSSGSGGDDGGDNLSDGKNRLETIVDIDQIDLVPTLSLLLSIPIPYQNLGLIIKDLFHSCTDCEDIQDKGLQNKKAVLNLLKNVNVNAVQVNNYIEKYLQEAGMDENLLKLNDNFNKINLKYEQAMREFKLNSSTVSFNNLESLANSFQEYIINVRKILRKSWAQFDILKMAIGLVITICTFILNVTFTLNKNSIFSIKMSSVLFISEIVLACCVYLNSEELSGIIFFIMLILFIYFIFISFKNVFPLSLSLQEYFSIAIWVIYTLSLLSNSYLVNESKVTQYFLKSSIFLQAILFIRECICSSSHSFFKQANTPKSVSLFSNLNVIKILIYTITIVTSISTFLNISKWYYSCREEQVDCVGGHMVEDPSMNSSIDPRNRLLISSLSLFTITIVAYKYLKSNGNLKGFRVATVTGKFLYFIMAAFIVIYWCFSAFLPANQSSSQLNTLVQFTYLIFITSTILLSIFPSTLHSFIDSPSQPVINLSHIHPSSTQVIPSLFHQLKSTWKSHPPNNQASKPTIYLFGLSTAYSSSLIILIINIILMLSLLLGSNVSSSLAVFVALLVLYLEFHATVSRFHCTNELDQMRDVSLTPIITFLLITSHHFYSLSHHPTITSIQWQAAFVGIHGDNVNNLLAAIMIGSNTFGAQIIGSLVSALLLYWPYTRGYKFRGSSGGKGNDNSNGNNKNNVKNTTINKISHYNNNQNKSNQDLTNADNDEDVGLKGEYLLKESGKLESSLAILLLKILSLLALKVFGVMVCVAIHRRHLMVWKIFAPRFIYEIVSFMLSSLILVLLFAFSMSNDKAIDKFINSLA